MPVTVVIGAQWGDEGKGRIVDLLAQKADVCVRFNGGDNAGHTVINNLGEFKLHLVPAGIFNPKTLCVIGNGVAVNPKVLMAEIDGLEQRGVSCQNLKISTKAHLIMPWHIIWDGLQENERKEGKIGTTKRGIGPVFSDKTGRFGFRVDDLISENMERRLRTLWDRQVVILLKAYSCASYDLMYDRILNDLLEFKRRISPFIAETEHLLWKACDKKNMVLMEGAQGILLDPDFGTYPQTTSSSCTLAGALQGSGISWREIKEVIGVVKAYTTRVCEKNHLFPTEMDEETGNILREQAGEYGATTGRARRIGWLDIPLLRYASKINGFTSLAITRMDNLGTLPKVKICQAHGKDGLPHYLEMPGGWNSDIKNRNAVDYLNLIESLAGVRIKYVSYGPERNQIIVKKRYLF